MPKAQPAAANRVVVLGASAGGVEALSTVIGGLPPDLPAAVLVVLHVPAWGTSVLPSILDRCGPMPAHHAVDGERLLNGRVYVAPPDRHLVTEDGVVRLTVSPKENGVRPSVDTLFRAVAQTHGSRVVAVVLSGTLDDGTAGLLSVKAQGGVTIVQDPRDAAFPSMPDSAMRFARPEYVVRADEVPALVAKLMGEAEQNGGSHEEDAAMERDSENGETAADQDGVPSELNCPECGGTLWEKADDDLMRFRCRVGHAYSPESLFSHQLESLEGALWAAVVALQERGDLAMRLAKRMSERHHHDRAERYERQAEDARRRAEQVRAAILHLSRSGEAGGDDAEVSSSSGN
jgi:two-component system chemotaxis response regulator CheB